MAGRLPHDANVELRQRSRWSCCAESQSMSPELEIMMILPPFSSFFQGIQEATMPAREAHSRYPWRRSFFWQQYHSSLDSLKQHRAILPRRRPRAGPLRLSRRPSLLPAPHDDRLDVVAVNWWQMRDLESGIMGNRVTAGTNTFLNEPTWSVLIRLSIIESSLVMPVDGQDRSGIRCVHYLVYFDKLG